MPQGEKWLEIKPRVAPPHKGVIKKHRDLFWKYIAERYNIYLLKEKEKLPMPWTDDPILIEYHFTNVYRKHDRGSCWLYDALLKDKKNGLDIKQMVWRIIQYRLPNYHTLFEDHGWIPYKFKRQVWLRRLYQTKEKHGRWFTNAHIVLQSNFEQSRGQNYLDYLAGISENFDEFWSKFVMIETMEEGFRLLKRMKGLGGFTSYEIMIDICTIGIKPKRFLNEFANPGPGCKEGIDLIYPNRTNMTYFEAMERLRNNQHRAFDRLGLAPPPEELTIQDIEFNLCEFSKYMKIHYDTGRKRRYRPHGTK